MCKWMITHTDISDTSQRGAFTIPGRDPVQTVRVLSWFHQRMTCVVARNYAQPIPHHASPGSIVVWEIRFHGEKDHAFN